MVREVLRERFLEALNELGGSVGNGRLRDRLGWQDDTYWAVHAALIEDGTIVAGRGRGGSVALAGQARQLATPATTPARQVDLPLAAAPATATMRGAARRPRAPMRT